MLHVRMCCHYLLHALAMFMLQSGSSGASEMPKSQYSSNSPFSMQWQLLVVGDDVGEEEREREHEHVHVTRDVAVGEIHQHARHEVHRDSLLVVHEVFVSDVGAEGEVFGVGAVTIVISSLKRWLASE